MRTFQNYYSVWRQFGGLPEFYSIPHGFTVDKREGYPLRPGQLTCLVTKQHLLSCLVFIPKNQENNSTLNIITEKQFFPCNNNNIYSSIIPVAKYIHPTQTCVYIFVSELIESAMYLFRATGDHTYLQLGLDALESIEKIAKTPCGYASVRSPVSC